MEKSLCTCKDNPLSVNCDHKLGFISCRFSASRHLLTMPARRKLTTLNRGRAIAWLHDGVSKCEVARRLGVSHSVIVRLNQRFQTTNDVEERPRSGRPKKTTPREDRFIQRQALQHRGTTCKVIRGQLRGATNTNVSERTIGNRLHDVRLRSRRPAVRPLLTQAHRRARLVWSRRHLRWTRRDWAQVLFSDESRFNLYHSDGRRKIWRREGERYEDDTVQERVAFGGGSVMVWGGGASAFITAPPCTMWSGISLVSATGTRFSPLLSCRPCSRLARTPCFWMTTLLLTGPGSSTTTSSKLGSSGWISLPVHQT